MAPFKLDYSLTAYILTYTTVGRTNYCPPLIVVMGEEEEDY